MDATWRADSTVGNYYRLWRQLEREGYRLPVKPSSPKYELHHNQGIKFCGAVVLEDCDIVEANRALRARDGCFILSPCMDAVYLRGLVDAHARGAVSDNMALPICMEYVASRGKFCVYPSGGFDDGEVSIYLLGLGESIVGSGVTFSVTSTQH